MFDVYRAREMESAFIINSGHDVHFARVVKCANINVDVNIVRFAKEVLFVATERDNMNVKIVKVEEFVKNTAKLELVVLIARGPKCASISD
uniref:Uncharacterized protein n=1 Tax=Pithovirus LCPAC404 TaxID=2506597 RepID=A0A481ZDU5_9VIRU|nr:MAG: hypothetical protein LCPAC404_03190 [Pithovirus LCPAC404]